MASKIFGGANLSDIARAAKERPDASHAESDKSAPGRPVLAAAELALTGRVAPPLERENIFSGRSQTVPAVEVSQPHRRLVHARSLPGSDRIDRQGWAAGARGRAQAQWRS